MKQSTTFQAAPDRAGKPRAGFFATGVSLTILCALCVAAVKPPPAGAQSQAEFVPTFSTNTRVKQQVDRLERLAAQKLWDEWLAGYQQLVDDPRDLVLVKDEEFLVGVRYHCHQLLAALPANVRQRYRQLYDVEARKIYDRGAADNDATAMRDVYSRYRFSSYANRALLWLANQALDEGRPEMARVAYSRLAKEPVASGSLLLKYALAADAAGRPAEATAALERVRKEFGAEPVQLAGVASTGSAAADRVSEMLKKDARHASGREWSSFSGPRGDRRMPASISGGLKQLWSFPHPTTPEGAKPATGGVVVNIGISYSIPRARFRFLTFPLVRGDRVWVQGPRNMTALDLNNGQPVWDEQDWVARTEEMPDPTVNVRGNRSSVVRWARAVQGAPSLEGHLVVARMPLAPGERTAAYPWPVNLALVGFDARSGRIMWRRVAAGEPKGFYWNIPSVQGNVIITGTTTAKGGITEYNALALDASSGEQLWSTYLGGGSDLFNGTDGSPAAIRDGIVWIESSIYTLNALDLVTGELRLIYRYTPDRVIHGRTRFRGGFDNTPQLTNEALSLIASGPGPILFAPRWGTDVVALDPAANGKLLWSSPKAGQSTLGAVFAADQKHVYVCGDYIQAINVADGAREWVWEVRDAAGSDVGFPALSGDRIYVPVADKIAVLSAADGKELEVLDISEGVKEGAGVASVTPLEGLVLVSTADGVVAFGPK
jgi:outer membrane protein assembly factor BamB